MKHKKLDYDPNKRWTHSGKIVVIDHEQNKDLLPGFYKILSHENGLINICKCRLTDINNVNMFVNESETFSVDPEILIEVSDWMSVEEKLYFEIHITLDPVEDAEYLKYFIMPYGFRLAKLFMQKGVISDLDSFITGRANFYSEALIYSNAMCFVLQNAGYKVRRCKIERVVYDDRDF